MKYIIKSISIGVSDLEAIDEQDQVIVDLLVSLLEEKQFGNQLSYSELNPGLKLSLDSDPPDRLILKADSPSLQVADSVRELLNSLKKWWKKESPTWLW